MARTERPDSSDMLVALAEAIKRKPDGCDWAASGEVRDFIQERWQVQETVAWVTARLQQATREGKTRRIRLVTTARSGRQRTVGYAWQLVEQPQQPAPPISGRERRRRELGLGIGALLVEPAPSGERG